MFNFNIFSHNLDWLQVRLVWWREKNRITFSFGHCADDWQSVSDEWLKKFTDFSFDDLIWHLQVNPATGKGVTSGRSYGLRESFRRLDLLLRKHKSLFREVAMM